MREDCTSSLSFKISILCFLGALLVVTGITTGYLIYLRVGNSLSLNWLTGLIIGNLAILLFIPILLILTLWLLATRVKEKIQTQWPLWEEKILEFKNSWAANSSSLPPVSVAKEERSEGSSLGPGTLSPGWAWSTKTGAEAPPMSSSFLGRPPWASSPTTLSEIF